MFRLGIAVKTPFGTFIYKSELMQQECNCTDFAWTLQPQTPSSASPGLIISFESS